MNRDDGMTPAQALYALIDQAAATPAEPTETALTELTLRLQGLEMRELDNSDTLVRCAESLEALTAAMMQLQELISASTSSKSTPRRHQTTTQDAQSAPAVWASSVALVIGCPAATELVLALRLKERAADGMSTIRLSFDARVIAVNRRSEPRLSAIPLPSLTLAGIPINSALGQSVDATPATDLALFCSLGQPGKWSTAIRAKKTDGSFGPLLSEARL
ncbi:hypothetical protein [Massilia psychrophila]|nr:hypothetical protein [Massilia psychrophila]GGE82073.1 hypothetical protein GCM10008020_28730 [Massilia psychrophila]